MWAILQTFNNREIAIMIWIVIFFIWVFLKKDVRRNVKKPLTSVLKLLFWGKIGTALLIMILNTVLVAFLLAKVHFWDVSLLKDTVFWFFGTGFIMFMNSNKIGSEKHYFKKALLDNLKFVVVLEFIINLYVFNIFVELLIVPAIFIIAAMISISKTKKEYLLAKKVLSSVLSVFGLIFISYALIELTTSFKDFTTLQNLKDFLLTPILTITYLPFLYFLVLYSTYELLFVRIDLWIKKDKQLANYLKWQTLKKCSLNLNKLNTFSTHLNKQLMFIKTRSDVTQIANGI